MARSCLRNKFLKTKTDANRKAYNRQRNYCVSLFHREKNPFSITQIQKRLSIINVSGRSQLSLSFQIKIELKTKLHLLRIKLKLYLITTLQQKCLTIFLQILSHRQVCNVKMICQLAWNIQGPLRKIIKNFKQHPSIIVTVKYKPNEPNFLFSRVVKKSIESLVKIVDSSKTIQKDNIPTKIIEENMDIMSNIFHQNTNKCFSESFFLDDLKRVEVMPSFLKKIRRKIPKI